MLFAEHVGSIWGRANEMQFSRRINNLLQLVFHDKVQAFYYESANNRLRISNNRANRPLERQMKS